MSVCTLYIKSHIIDIYVLYPHIFIVNILYIVVHNITYNM